MNEWMDSRLDIAGRLDTTLCLDTAGRLNIAGRLDTNELMYSRP